MKALFWNTPKNRLSAGMRILVFLLVASVLTIPVAIVLKQVDGFLETTSTNLLIMIAMLTAIAVSGKYCDKRKFSDFGITLQPIQEFGKGIVYAGVSMVLIWIVLLKFDLIELKQVRFNQFSNNSFFLVFVGQVFRYLFGSIFEEAFTRGYLLKNIAEGFNVIVSKKTAVLIGYFLSSSLFGILHFANDSSSIISTINLSLIGLFFGWTVITTGKLHFAIGMHMSWNIIQNNVFGFHNSGKEPIVSFYKYVGPENNVWTGGKFGPEGGLLCTIVIAVFLSFLIIRDSKSGKFTQRIIKE